MSLEKRLPSGTHTWRIENYTKIMNGACVEEFDVACCEWRMLFYPNGDGMSYKPHLSVYHEVPDDQTLPNGWFRHVANEVLMREKVPTKDLYLNLKSSDTWVAEYRKWMNKVGHGMPYHFGHSTVSLPELPAEVEHAPAGLVAGASASVPAKGGLGTMHAPNLANRYFRHVIHCKVCRAVVKAFEAWKNTLSAVAAALTAMAILACSRQGKVALLMSAAASLGWTYACSTVVAMNTTNFIRIHRRL